jgi:acetylornithine deacetylase/succinyl-diaminopimelate desuccinylase-like protein
MDVAGGVASVQEYLNRNADQAVEQLKEFLRIPSISAQPDHKADMQRAAQWVRDQFQSAGLTTEIVPTAGHPIVYAEWTGAPGAPTVLVYGHYDVQPPDPLDQWITPPFEPTIRDGRIYARGATDDKGQVLTHVLSAAAWLKTVGKLPVNVKFVIEGEEEVGSNNLDRFLEEQRDRCRCDVAVISDTAQFAPGVPAITYGLRGIVACEVFVSGPSQDLHSGVFGGSVANPANGLARMIAALHDAQGRVQIPDFYNDVVPLTDGERRNYAKLPFDEASYLNGLGISAVHGETGFTTLERRWARPTCDVNGMISGYTGVGPKTIVPARASVKLTCRLVPNQDAHKVLDSLRVFLEKQLLPGLRMEFREYHGAPGVLCDLNSPWMQAARRAIAAGFGKEPVMIREGGSIPVVGSFKQILGVDTLLLGWGQNTDNLHSPNESFTVEDFHRGTRASAQLWAELAGSSVVSGP